MWVFTPLGFFSATLTNSKYKELPLRQQVGHIMVRARVREDLVRLVAEHQRFGMGDRPEILDLPGHDYPYRIVIPREEWIALAARLAEMIDYSNFKSAVEEKALDGFAGQARHDLYMKVWGVMHGAEGWLRKRVADLRRPKPKQGGLGFWESPGRYRSDPRSDADMQALYQPMRGWEEWLAEDEEQAIVCDLPEGTDTVIDIANADEIVIDNPTNDDIAAFEAAMIRTSRRNRRR